MRFDCDSKLFPKSNKLFNYMYYKSIFIFENTSFKLFWSQPKLITWI